MSSYPPVRPSDQQVGTRPTWLQALIILGVFEALLWALEILDAATPRNSMDRFGIQPRTVEGLVGIVVAPLLHVGFGHLMANTIPVLILGFLVLVSGIRRGLTATAIIWLTAGLGVWLFGAENTVHLGASSLIFGWLVYLMIRGFFSRRIGEIVLGVVVLLLYGGLLLGVLPGQDGVSWLGHLFGAIGGAIAAVSLSERKP